MLEPAAAETAVARLEQDGLVHRERGVTKTTRRWQGAMARAALRLVTEGESREDLRIPVVMALVDVYGSGLDDEDLVAMVGVILPLESVQAPRRVRQRSRTTAMPRGPSTQMRRPSKRGK
jgi:hypothetical protein